MTSVEIIINLEEGLHARPASVFVKKANQFDADIMLKKEGTEVNAKSIMGIMMLALYKGSRVTLSADGEDEEKAVQTLKEFCEQKK
jgi:phosphotransferase system HPr (HPr) family protein